MIDAGYFTPLDENSYGENILRDDTERGYFMTQIYFRGANRRSYIPAFSFVDAPAGNFSLEFSANQDGTNRRKFTENAGFYFDDAEEETLGWSTIGVTYIFVLKDGKIYGAPHKLLIVPDRKECEAMIREIIFIRSELFQKTGVSKSNLPEEIQSLRNVKDWSKVLEHLEKHVEELFQIMKRIDERPRYSLQKVQSSCHLSKVRRFDSKIFQQYTAAPNRPRYRVLSDKISVNIFENRLLRSKIFRLREFIAEHSAQQKNNAEIADQNIKAQTEYVEKLSDAARKKNEDDKYIVDNTLKNLNNRRTLNAQNLNSSPDKIIAVLNDCLNLRVLREADRRDEKWRMTQIFTNDANYRRAYRKLRELDEIFDFSFVADENSMPAEKMYQIYEWWVLAKIVEFLVVKLNWRVGTGDDPVKILRALFDNLENIQRVHICLTHENPAMVLELYYNATINESLKTSGCRLRPDYLFKVSANGVTRIFILDAKYRNYEQKGWNCWLKKDLQGVCTEKYISEIKKSTGVKISVAFIVHPDSTPADNGKFLGKYVVYNGTVDARTRKVIHGIADGGNQQFGSFYLLPSVEKSTPNQSEVNLSLFFKLMFEYFMEKWETCWECDSADVERTALQTGGGFTKYHLRCNSCGAFWVKTHCWNCGKHNALIKHAINYHAEQSGKWFVYCPHCGG